MVESNGGEQPAEETEPPVWEEFERVLAAMPRAWHKGRPCCGQGCGTTSRLTIATVAMLKSWPDAWDKSHIRTNPWPVLCKKCGRKCK